MDENHFDHHPATTKHEHDIDVDENLLAKLPQGSKLKSAKGAGESNWNLTGHVIFETREDKEEEYFLKVRPEHRFGERKQEQKFPVNIQGPTSFHG
ncbi:MAG: hypothetical protein Q9171_002754 [Xanthocarpia ochracea]